jgi:polar amino acid transport system ATP-binding protein
MTIEGVAVTPTQPTHTISDNVMVSIKKMNKKFGGFHVLKDIDLEVRAGERIVICGPSGSGKSTLIRCINGLEPIQGGSITVDGIELSKSAANLRAVRQHVGMVFQQFNLFPHLTAVENCMLAPRKVLGLTKEQAKKIALTHLDQVRVGDQADKYPAQLSGGQQQRVAIARALCMSPKVMLFDEATSSLDPEMVKEVLDTMIRLAKEGMTMVCVTHEMGFARAVADQVYFVDHGRIVESAPPQDFFAAPKTERARNFLSQIL